MSPREALGVFLRGLGMGAADVVPGVSGGTIAFISGIYPRLIKSLTSFDLAALRLVFGLDIRAAWKHVDGNFLVILFAGIFCSIFSLAHAISFLLEQYPVLLWAFFFGLILASAIWMLRDTPDLKPIDAIPLALGVAFILVISTTGSVQLSPILPLVFLAGCIAISAMLLPGVSGSFLLLLMGLYASTIDAVKSLDLAYIFTFAAGAGVGFLAFSRVINWLLKRFYRPTMLFLIGLLFGSIYVVWPWKVPAGELTRNVLPEAYAAQIGEPMIVLSALAFIVGIGLVVGLEMLFGKLQTEQSTDSN